MRRRSSSARRWRRIERDGAPWLTIDCGGEGLTAYLAHYGDTPRALFVTHTHLDHVAGFERLFVASYFDEARRGTRARCTCPRRWCRCCTSASATIRTCWPKAA